MLDSLALEGTKQIRSDAVGAPRSTATHFAFGKEGLGRCRVRRYGNLGEGHPANVRSDAESRRVCM